ncbi:MAG: hypothetical protein JG718_08045 [Candidatus Thiothrix moscowensis]|nr:hypothetical protein [Candidatus Thiothrix moscowensis]
MRLVFCTDDRVVLQVQVCGHEPKFHLSQVQFAGGVMQVFAQIKAMAIL